MTPRDLAIWAAVYAAAWFEPTGLPPGVPSDLARAGIAVQAADRALAVLRLIRPEEER